MSSDLYGRTRRLELADQNLRSFEAVVLASSPDGIVLSTSAFYPGGGGQPADRGVLLWQGVEAACNAEVTADRRIDVRVLPRAEAFAIPDIIRTATNLVPETVEEVRIIDIVGLDCQADGGTHVASTKQIGRIRVAKIESKGKGFRRLRIEVAD
jgi:Ser-tRNA(Ala) deacylase AlaX